MLSPACQRRGEHTEIHHRTGGSHQRETQESAQRPHPDPPGIEHEFGDVGQPKLALALFAIHEVHRDFFYHSTQGHGLVKQGDLEGIAFHAQGGEIDLAQNRGADGPEAGRAVANAVEAGNVTRHPVAAGGIQLPQQAPFGRNTAALDVPAADDEIRRILQRRQQARHVSRIVGEVRIHFEHHIRIELIQGVAHAANVGRPQPGLLSGDEVQVAHTLHGRTDPVGGSIGRIIIHHENVHVVLKSAKLAAKPTSVARQYCPARCTSAG